MPSYYSRGVSARLCTTSLLSTSTISTQSTSNSAQKEEIDRIHDALSAASPLLEQSILDHEDFMRFIGPQQDLPFLLVNARRPSTQSEVAHGDEEDLSSTQRFRASSTSSSIVEVDGGRLKAPSNETNNLLYSQELRATIDSSSSLSSVQDIEDNPTDVKSNGKTSTQNEAALEAENAPDGASGVPPGNHGDSSQIEDGWTFNRGVRQIRAETDAINSSRSLRSARSVPPLQPQAIREPRGDNKIQNRQNKTGTFRERAKLHQDNSKFHRDVRRLSGRRGVDKSARQLRSGRSIPAQSSTPTPSRKRGSGSIKQDPSNIKPEAPTSEITPDDHAPSNQAELLADDAMHLDSDKAGVDKQMRTLRSSGPASSVASDPPRKPFLTPSPALDLTSVQSSTTDNPSPDALVLAVNLDPKSFQNCMDIKIEVFYNGEFCASAFLSGQSARPGNVTSYPIIFSGHRLHCGLERPWLLLGPEQIPPVRHEFSHIWQVCHAQERWDDISKELRSEAAGRGVNKHGEPSPSSEYLQSLASLPFLGSATAGSSIGVIDLVISLGRGKKYSQSQGYMYKPGRMPDSRYSTDNRAMPGEDSADVQEVSSRLTSSIPQIVSENISTMIGEARIQDVAPSSSAEQSDGPPAALSAILDATQKPPYTSITGERTERPTGPSDRVRTELQRLDARLQGLRSSIGMSQTWEPNPSTFRDTETSSSQFQRRHTRLQAKLGHDIAPANVLDKASALSNVASDHNEHTTSLNRARQNGISVSQEHAETPASRFEKRRQTRSSIVPQDAGPITTSQPGQSQTETASSHLELPNTFAPPWTRSRTVSEYTEPASHSQRPPKRSKMASEPSPPSQQVGLTASTDVESSSSFERPNTRFRYLARPSVSSRRSSGRRSTTVNTDVADKVEARSPATKERQLVSHVEIEQQTAPLQIEQQHIVPQQNVPQQLTTAQMASRAGVKSKGRLMSRLATAPTANILYETSAWPESMPVQAPKKRGRPAKRRKTESTEDATAQDDLTASLPSVSSLLQQSAPTLPGSILQAEAQSSGTLYDKIVNKRIDPQSLLAIYTAKSGGSHAVDQPQSSAASSMPRFDGIKPMLSPFKATFQPSSPIKLSQGNPFKVNFSPQKPASLLVKDVAHTSPQNNIGLGAVDGAQKPTRRQSLRLKGGVAMQNGSQEDGFGIVPTHSDKKEPVSSGTPQVSRNIGDDMITQQAVIDQKKAIKDLPEHDPPEKSASTNEPQRPTDTERSSSCIAVADRRATKPVASRRHFQTRTAAMAETHDWEMPETSKGSVCTYAEPALCGNIVIGQGKGYEKDIVAGMCRPIKQDIYAEFEEESVLVGMRFVVN